MQDLQQKDYEEFEFADRPAAFRPWREPDLAPLYYDHYIGHTEALANNIFPDDHRGHELWSARVQPRAGEAGLLVDNSVVMCSRCGCYAFSRVQELVSRAWAPVLCRAAD